MNALDRFLYNQYLKVKKFLKKEKEFSKPMDETERANYWINKFPKKEIIYKAQDDMPRDVRNFIVPRSYIFDKVIPKYKLRQATHDETVLKCCLFVQKYIKYVGDMESRGQHEFWQYPEDTITRGTGDCEDMSILMKSLTLACDVPDWKVKVLAGEVKGGGHAYCTYIRSNDTQCIMDACYWPNKLPVDLRNSIEQEENYYDIWFSFNYNYTYAEEKLVYTKGKIK